MTMELVRQATPQPRLRTVRVEGELGGSRLTQIEHAARRFAPHFFSTYAVGVVESGQCSITTPRGSWIAGPGSLVAFAPSEPHWAQVLSGEPYGYRMAYLSDECMRSMGFGGAGAGEASPRALVTVTPPSTRSLAFLESHRAVSDDPEDVNEVTGLLRSTRDLLRSAAGPPPDAVAARDATLTERAKEFLAAHIGHRVSLGRVADTCGVTAFHLIRVFRRVTGLSPYSYLMVMRVNEARRLLDAGAPVSDAVHACSFSDQSHLTRIFKRTLGLAPGQYLRASR